MALKVSVFFLRNKSIFEFIEIVRIKTHFYSKNTDYKEKRIARLLNIVNTICFIDRHERFKIWILTEKNNKISGSLLWTEFASGKLFDPNPRGYTVRKMYCVCVSVMRVNRRFYTMLLLQYVDPVPDLEMWEP